MRKLLFGLFVASTLVSAIASAHAETAKCQNATSELHEEKLIAQGLLSVARTAAGREIDCVGTSQGQGDMHAHIFLGQEPGIEIALTDTPAENLMILSSKIEANRISYSLLDTGRTSAIEIQLKKLDDGRWAGELTDVGEPGNPSRTWKLSCN